MDNKLRFYNSLDGLASSLEKLGEMRAAELVRLEMAKLEEILTGETYEEAQLSRGAE